ncbi:helicase protein, partial [Necator americanus]
NGGRSKDHFDLKRLKRDSYGIPQDISKRYFVFAQREFQDPPSHLQYIPPWLIRHFEYAIQLSLDFFNDLKFKKVKELRKSQKELPIAERKDEIIKLLKDNQVLIIAGDTGCGKSTQVPQYLLQSGYTGIACTQPRRIACTALARRVAYETLNAYGSEVAYQIRFETTKSKRTKMVFLTEGLLLRQMENDSLLQQYNVVILDEIHERHLSSDLLIGLLRDMIGKRDDLKLILMSATINLELFKGYFEGAPVIQVIIYLLFIPFYVFWKKKLVNDAVTTWLMIPTIITIYHFRFLGDCFPYNCDTIQSSSLSLRVRKRVTKLIRSRTFGYSRFDFPPFSQLIDKQVPSTERGDALIFLNGVAEITTVAESLKTYAELTKAWIILMLHSTLSVEEQDKVFDVAPSGVRKCILSTNIAETSVTIDGIRFVIDSGKVNLIKHETGSGTQKLSEFWVSKASADQRKGRAGRTGPGICYRLYSEEQYNKMDDFTTSEINRVSLQEMALRMISLNLGLDPRTFPFIEHPETEKLNDALDILKFQGVLYPDRDNQLTILGSAIAKLPVDVPIAKSYEFVIYYYDNISPFVHQCHKMSSSIVSTFSSSDLCVICNEEIVSVEILFREWVLQKCTGGKVRRWALENGIDEHRMYEISKLRSQYRQVLEDAGLIDKPDAHELGQDDSRQRRIDQGDRKKLLDMKRDARNQEKTQKILRADKHFDSILNEKEEEDLENEQDPMKTDVKTVEFLLSYKQRDVEIIRRTHKFRRKEAELIRVVIAAGLYPQYTIADPMNKYQHGQELFVHTRMKPFSLIHPNSSIAQYHAESLDAHADSEGRSTFHQILFYGLLLETTKPYICNVIPIPALGLLLFSKKVMCDDWKLVLVDDFVEISFERIQQCKEVMHSIVDIRKHLNTGLQRKLRGLSYNPSELSEIINRFAYTLAEGDVEISVKRIVHPPRTLENVGFFLPDGEVELDVEEYVLEDADEFDDSNQEKEECLDDVPKQESEGVQIKEEPPEQKERKPTYYEILQKKMREREAKTADTQPCEKKPRVE